jgi:uncharacterized protein YcbK (DUF882 family)
MGDLSEHFSREEFACKCGCGAANVSPKLIDALEMLRDLAGKSIKVNCGLRCVKHNSEVGGEKNSRHLLGQAADIKIRSMSPLEVFILAEQVPAFRQGGRGVYDTFTHVDVGTGNKRPSVWDKRVK